LSARRGLAFVLAGVVLVVVAALVWAWRGYAGPGPLAEGRAVVIPKNQGTRAVAALLEAKGVIADGRLFVAGAWVSGLARRLRAGEFAFPPGASMAEVAYHLAYGTPVVRRLTIAEGLTTAQALALVAEAEGLDGAAPVTVAEGALFPDTYNYSWGDGRAEMVARMKKAMDETLAKLWAARGTNLAVATPAEALALASIIEKETAVPAERPLVSAVFRNRLKRGMKLQSDPTVVYAVAKGAGPLARKLTRADLEADSPYNTYLNPGLPPGPIGAPGRAAIEAALHPAPSEALYFVADGSGGHVFAKTLDEHNRNVARWRALQP
jgi:UPF0755 protein